MLISDYFTGLFFIILRLMKHILLFIFLMAHSVAHSQNDFRSGYRIDLTGDTIAGAINFKDDSYLHLNCEFQSANLEVFDPTEIFGFHVDDKLFLSKRINDRSIFLKTLLLGDVNVYTLKEYPIQRLFLEKRCS